MAPNRPVFAGIWKTRTSVLSHDVEPSSSYGLASFSSRIWALAVIPASAAVSVTICSVLATLGKPELLVNFTRSTQVNRCGPIGKDVSSASSAATSTVMPEMEGLIDSVGFTVGEVPSELAVIPSLSGQNPSAWT